MTQPFETDAKAILSSHNPTSSTALRWLAVADFSVLKRAQLPSTLEWNGFTDSGTGCRISARSIDKKYLDAGLKHLRGALEAGSDMGHVYAQTMFTEAVKRIQEDHHSRRQYERLAEQGERHDALSAAERDFIGRRDSFYLATVTSDGWPYVQHRGGPPGFLHVTSPKTLAFADFAGNKQYISTGNLMRNPKVALFLMDYPNQARLKLIGHARVLEPQDDPDLLTRVTAVSYRATIERIFLIDLVAFDWNCSQHITPRYTEPEVKGLLLDT